MMEGFKVTEQRPPPPPPRRAHSLLLTTNSIASGGGGGDGGGGGGGGGGPENGARNPPFMPGAWVVGWVGWCQVPGGRSSRCEVICPEMSQGLFLLSVIYDFIDIINGFSAFVCVSTRDRHLLYT